MDDTGFSVANLAPFLPRFEAPGFEFGSWAHPTRHADGSQSMDYYVLGPTASEFVQTCYDHKLIVRGFDWPSWASTPRARELFDDHQLIADATAPELACMLTTIIRSDRFDEGALGQAYDSGLLIAILRRAAMLVAGGATADD